MLFWRLCVLTHLSVFLFLLNDSFGLGEESSSVLRRLRNARESLFGKEIDVHCITTRENMPGAIFEDETIISYPNQFFAFTTYLQNDNDTRNGQHHFSGCIGDQSLFLSPENFVPNGSSGGGLMEEKSGNLISMRGGTKGSQVLMYYPSGEDMLSVLDAIPPSSWKSSTNSHGKQILVGESDGRVHTLTLNSENGFPISKYEFTFVGFPTTIEYSGVNAFSDNPHPLIPKKVVITIGYKDGPLKWQSEVRDVRKARIPPGVQSWKEVTSQIGLPNGTRITVKDMRQINFKWQDGEIVRSVDGKKLDTLRGHAFWGTSSRVWVVCGFVLIAIGAVWTFRRWKRSM